jgi:hypothetical protein
MFEESIPCRVGKFDIAAGNLAAGNLVLDSKPQELLDIFMLFAEE